MQTGEPRKKGGKLYSRPLKNIVVITDILLQLLCKQLLEFSYWILACCFTPVSLLLSDEAVQFAEMLFFLTFFGLEQKIHLPDDILCD